MKFLAALCLACCALPCSSASLFYFSGEGGFTAIPLEQSLDPATTLSLLSAPPPGLGSALPVETRVIEVSTKDSCTFIEFSSEVLMDLGDSRLEAISEQVRATLHTMGIEGSVRLQCGGRELSDYLPPKPFIEPRPALGQSQAAPSMAPGNTLAGKSVSLSPGHGKVWLGTGYNFERPVYCAPLSREDDHNLEIMAYLNQYLLQDGALTKVYRCLDKNFGTHTPSGEPWWRISAGYWLQQNGYPCSVYGSLTGCTLNSGASEGDDSLRSRGLASDYDNTTIYVSLHSNGYKGDCSGSGCPNGTCTYYYTGGEHAPWGTVSRNLAASINTAIVQAIRTQYGDTTWQDRGAIDNNFAETRIPDRPAALIELAFHDSCDRDAVYLRDNFFRSTTMWATYKGICDYFGVTPGWAYYSCEVVSDTIPDTMQPGANVQATITVRNRGVLWNEARNFRLGAVGTDPFSATNRYHVGTEVGPGQTKTFILTLKAPTTEGFYTTDWRMVRENIAWFGPTISKNILVSTTGDTEPPTIPANLAATPVAYNQVNLSWQASTDNLRVSHYKIFRDSAFVGTSVSTAFSDSNRVSKTTYSYQVAAVDGAGNESARSAVATATTPPILDIILDNPQGTFTGLWTLASSSTDKYESDYRFASTVSSQSAAFRWTPRIEQPGFYNVFAWYPEGSNRCTNSPYRIQYAGGSVVRYVNQTTGGGGWVSLGAARPFITGNSGYIELGNQTEQPSKVVLADAVRFTYASALPALPNLNAQVSGMNLTLTWSNPYCVLQQTSSLSSPTWTDVTGATSPHTVVHGATGQKFYRLRY